MRLNPWIKPRHTWQKTAGTVAFMFLGTWLVWTLALGQQPISLAIKNAAPSTAPTTYDPFPPLPDATTQPLPKSLTLRGFATNPGTAGLTLPIPTHRTGATIAILGDLAPTNDASAAYLQRAVNELNLLRPDLVLTVGNLIDGLSRSGEQYAHQAAATHTALDRLAMPWYPCVGDRDTLSGTLDPKDRRFADLYQIYFGPRYYSLDCGDLHILILDSEEPLPATVNPNLRGISDEQAAWAKADLARTFEAHQASAVFVVIHRPLWHEPNGTWSKIHELLVDFNHKPIVSVEPAEDSGATLRGPKVLGVFAGDQRTATQDPSRDGIPYYVVGATSAVLEQDASELLRHYTLVRVDAAPAATPHIAFVQMGAASGAAGGIVPPDTFLSDERQVIARLAAIDDKSLALAGAIEQPLGKDVGSTDSNSGAMRLILANPLNVPIDVELRLASTRNLSTPTLRENANPYVENFDSAWELFTPYANRHLAPGASERWSSALFCSAQTGEIPPPQVEFLVHWNDSRGRTHTVILKRRIPVIPAAAVPIAPTVKIDTDEGWQNSVHGSTYSWTPSVYERQKRSPDWDMTADARNLYIRIRSDDDHPSYSPNLSRPAALLSDAVSIAWAPTLDAVPATVQRIVLLPFAEGKDAPQLLTNNGVGASQTQLLPLDTKTHPAAFHVVKRDGVWEATLAIPRTTVFRAGGTTCWMNIAVHDNDGGAETFVRSWAKEDGGPGLWGRVTLTSTPAPPAPK